MAGHSKWKQIKHYKAATDAKRGAQFTKLIREITMAAKLGGGDPAGNPAAPHRDRDGARRLDAQGEHRARGEERHRRARRASTIRTVTYEGYGPGGVAIIIFALTDNPTRTVADVRHRLSRGGGNLGAPTPCRSCSIAKDRSMLDADGQRRGRRDGAGARGRRGRLRARRRSASSSRPSPTSLHDVQQRARGQRRRIDGSGDCVCPEEHGARAGEAASAR